jgi:hypothetical protein
MQFSDKIPLALDYSTYWETRDETIVFSWIQAYIAIFGSILSLYIGVFKVRSSKFKLYFPLILKNFRIVGNS